jgi:HSP20 family molecular chaperone IbpA
LRWTVNLHDAKAEVANGMLIVRLPKIEDRRGVEFKIPVKDAGSE